MTEEERYAQIDLPFYREHVAPVLPAEVLDFHTHTWRAQDWQTVPWETDAAGSKYMVTIDEYPIEELLSDCRTIFPDRPYHAVCFGFPTPAADLAKTNAYLAGARAHQGLFPLLITGKVTLPKEELSRTIREGGFFGYKVFLNWYGDDYGAVRIEDMLGPAEMEVADELGLVILWHVPRARRLADPDIQQGIRDYAQRYPNTRIVLAHCGRCYLPDEMAEAIGAIADLPNVYLDTAMVMDPTVLEIVFQRIGPARVVYATDLPIANMRGRRVYVMDHWVDVVLEGYPPSAYRLASNDIHATFMCYEIVLAIKRAADRTGLSQTELAGVFYGNGMSLLQRVMDGRQMTGIS
ncbi:MAG: amidohydrolase family protein [Armatimonadota bacterium]